MKYNQNYRNFLRKNFGLNLEEDYQNFDCPFNGLHCLIPPLEHANRFNLSSTAVRLEEFLAIRRPN